MTWAYDNALRPVRQTVGDQPLDFTWNLDGSLASVGALRLGWDSTSRLSGDTLNSMTRRYTHNVRGALVADTVRFGSTVLRAVRHERDALGRVTGTTESVGASSVSWRYHYDASGALDSVWRNGALSSWWGYDSNGVRVSGSGVNGVTHDAADRVLSQNGVTFTYDANGRLVSRRAGVSETRYVYDLRGGLRAVDLPSGDRITYGVDASGRRISRSVNGAVTHRWLWEGNLRPVGEVDSTGRVLARYVYGTRANVPDAIVRHDTLYRVITDERGSVRMVVNASTGEVASSLMYDAWGNVTESVHAEFQPFGFGGGLRDDATGLVRMGARDYAPELGRWTATDPIGFEGGDANLYGYLGNDPVNYVDPTGLVVGAIGCEVSLIGGGGGVVGGGVLYTNEKVVPVELFFYYGFGVGMSAGASVFAALVDEYNNFKGKTLAVNGSGPLVGGSQWLTEDGSQPTGGTASLGVSPLPGGGSLTVTETKTWSPLEPLVDQLTGWVKQGEDALMKKFNEGTRR